MVITEVILPKGQISLLPVYSSKIWIATIKKNSATKHIFWCIFLAEVQTLLYQQLFLCFLVLSLPVLLRQTLAYPVSGYNFWSKE